MKSFAMGIGMTVALAFAEDAKAQVALPSAVLNKDTIPAKIYPAKNSGYMLVSERNDTLRLWKAKSQFDLGETPLISVSQTGKGAHRTGTVMVEFGENFYVIRNLNGAETLMFLKKVGTEQPRIRRRTYTLDR